MTQPAPSTEPARPRLRRFVYGVLILLALLAVAGFVYQNIFEARDRRFNPMPGRRVLVGGGSAWPQFSMHIDCTGEGAPAVILDSGLGDSYVSWRKVQPQIGKFTRVCSYDRAGIGYSDPSPRIRTSQTIAEELHALLQASGINPPYILVGHSLGGFNVRVFAGAYRSEVVGMVLVDASHPEQDNRFPAELKNMEGSWRREIEFMEYAMPLGIPRLLGWCEDDPVARAALCNFHSAREYVAETNSIPESAAQTAASGRLGDLPLIVLSHDPDKPSGDVPADLAKPMNDAWGKMQEELAQLSTRGRRLVVKNSSHYIQIDQPEVVVDAVKNVVDQVRAPASSGIAARR